MKADVSILRCQTYEAQTIRNCIEKICENAGFPDVNGKKVLLKPNILSDSDPSFCITTNPEVLRQTIRYCRDKGSAAIYVGDSPGLQGPDFKPVNSGIWDICQEEGAVWTDFTKNPVQKDILFSDIKLPIAGIADEADVIIGLSKMKNHQLMYVTGSVKNFFGTVPSLNKSMCHMRFQSRESFAKLVIGIHETVKPDFSIMDAVIGMEGAGPANGHPRAVGLLMASRNDFALDYAQAAIMGYRPEEIPVLAQAKALNVLPDSINYTDLDAKDVVIQDFDRIPYRKKTNFISKLIIPFIKRGHERKMQQKEPKPLFSAEQCIHCLKCVNICPGHALAFSKEDKCIIADYSKCIRCYCCHEMCPADAIKIEQ